MTQVPTHDPSPAASLVGTHCASCDRMYYPARDLCPICWTAGLASGTLPPTGSVATWTVVRMGKRFPTPYALCYADFDGDVRVLGRVTNWSEGMQLRPGMTVTTHVDEVEHTYTIDLDELES